MNRTFYIGLVAVTAGLLTATNLFALPRSAEKISSVPTKHFKVKMILNQVDLGEDVDVELTNTTEECANYRSILSQMHKSKDKKLDESFFESIGLSSQIFTPFMRMYEKTRRYSVDLFLAVLKKKNVQIPLEKVKEEKQGLIKDFVASDRITDEEMDQLDHQEQNIYHFLKNVYAEYIRSGNKVLSQEFHFKRLTGFLQDVVRDSCENNPDLTRKSLALN
jgi:hypothetical protein